MRGTTIKNDVSLTCMEMIDPAMGWFEIFEVPTFVIDKVTVENNEYIDNSSDRASHLFNNTWLSRYPITCKLVFEKIYEFKRDFTTLKKDLDIKYI